MVLVKFLVFVLTFFFLNTGTPLCMHWEHYPVLVSRRNLFFFLVAVPSNYSNIFGTADLFHRNILWLKRALNRTLNRRVVRDHRHVSLLTDTLIIWMLSTGNWSSTKKSDIEWHWNETRKNASVISVRRSQVLIAITIQTRGVSAP